MVRSGHHAPLPGYHRLSTGEHMRDDQSSGMLPIVPGMPSHAIALSDAVGNARGFEGVSIPAIRELDVDLPNT